MFLKYKVDIPVVPGKLVRKKRGGHTYVEFEYDRIYDPVKQYTYPKRASIGRVDPENQNRMTPNENFLKYFPDADIPEEIDRSERSPYLNIGPYIKEYLKINPLNNYEKEYLMAMLYIFDYHRYNDIQEDLNHLIKINSYLDKVLSLDNEIIFSSIDTEQK